MIEVRCQTPGCDKVVPIPDGMAAEGLRCPRCRVPLGILLPPAATSVAETTTSDLAPLPVESSASHTPAEAAGSEVPPSARRRRLMLGGLLAGVSAGLVGWLLLSSFFRADDAAVPAEPMSNPAPAGPASAVAGPVEEGPEPAPLPIPLPSALKLSAVPGVQLELGEQMLVEVAIERKNFAGPVRVRLEGLPPRVMAGELVIAADQSAGRIELAAARDGNEGKIEARLVAVAGDLKASHDLQILVLKPVPFQLLPVADLVLRPSQPKEFTVRVRRKEMKGFIHVFVDQAPNYVVAGSGAIPPGKEEVTLELTPAAAGGRVLRPSAPAAPAVPGTLRLRAVLGDHTAEADINLLYKVNELRQLAGHTDIIMSAAVSPDGRLVASASKDRTVRIWDVLTGEVVHRLEGHHDDVMAVAFSPDGNLLLSGGGDGSVRLWDADTGQLVQTLEGHSRLINSVVFSPDGSQAASGSGDQTIRLWDLADGKEIRRFKGHLKYVTSVAFSPDGTRIVSASGDGTARVWEAKTGKELLRLQHRDVVNRAVFSPDGKLILTGAGSLDSPFCAVHLWNAQNGNQLGFVWNPSQVQSVAFSPDGRRVLFGSWDSTIRILDVETGQEVRRLEGYTGLVLSAGFFPDGVGVLFSGNNNSLFLWDVAGEELGPFEGHRAKVNSIVFSRDGALLLSGSDDRTARLWDAKTGRELRRFEGHLRGVTCVALSPDGALALTGAGPGDPAARLWDVKSGQQLGRFPGHPLGLQRVAFHADGSQVLTVGIDGIVHAWNVKTGVETGRLLSGGGLSAFSRDPFRLLAGGFAPLGLRLWDMSTARELGRLAPPSLVDALPPLTPDGQLPVPEAPAQPDARPGQGAGRRPALNLAWNNLGMSGDGRWAVLGGPRERAARLFDLHSGKQTQRFGGHTFGLTSVAFAADGEHVLSGGNFPDGTVRLWSVQTGDEIRRLEWWNQHAVQCLAFSPDDRTVAAAGGSLQRGVIRLWTLDDNRYEIPPYARHARGIYRIAIDRNGSRAVSAAGDQTLRLWEVPSGRELMRFEAHAGAVWNAQFLPDGKTLLSAGEDSTVRFWDLGTGRELRRFDLRALALEEKTVEVPVAGGGGVGVPTPAPQLALKPLTSPRHQDHNLWLREVKVAAQPPPLPRPIPQPQPAPTPSPPTPRPELRYLWPTVSRAQSVAFSPDGGRALVGHPNGMLRLVELKTGRELRRFGKLEQGTIRVGLEPVRGVALSPDGKRAASLCGKLVHLWDITSGKQVHEWIVLEGTATGLGCIAFSPDGQQLLAADGKAIRLIDSNGQRERSLEGHTAEVRSVAFSADGRLALSTAADHTVRVWDLVTGRTRHCFEGHEREVWSAALAPDGAYLLSGGGPRESMLRPWKVSR